MAVDETRTQIQLPNFFQYAFIIAMTALRQSLASAMSWVVSAACHTPLLLVTISSNSSVPRAPQGRTPNKFGEAQDPWPSLELLRVALWEHRSSQGAAPSPGGTAWAGLRRAQLLLLQAPLPGQKGKGVSVPFS